MQLISIEVYSTQAAYRNFRKTGLQRLEAHQNAPLQEIFLLIAKWDIVIEQGWVEEKRNGLIDALRRLGGVKPGLLPSLAQLLLFDEPPAT